MSRLLLPLILLLAFALRIYGLGSQSLWYDEAVTAQVVQQGLAELARWTAGDIQPPLYYAITAGWVQLAGLSEWALRFPSVFFGVLLVPLAYALAQRLFDRTAGTLAALLAALHPLWLYYSQEARMYTLLTALGMVAGYALLRILAAGHSQDGYPKTRLRWWLVFALMALALLYTHYFAAFLLLAFGLYFLLMLLVQRSLHRRRLLVEGAGTAVLVVLAYLPWLPNALRRFGEDASYWQGALKLDEALRHIAISFSTGETVLEQQAIPLAWAVAALALICLIALLWTSFIVHRSSFTQSRRVGGPEWIVHRSSILFVLLYLLVPIAGILLLSTNNPKFNPRYLMLASPALVLLLAGGLSLPFRLRSPLTIDNSPLTIDNLLRLLSLLALISLLAIFAFSISNWFADPAFTKDDWRGTVAYVKSQLRPDEAVILVSGHAYPAWRYYAPDVEPLRLPASETLDVNAVLTLEPATQALSAGLVGTEGAWLVQWQDEVVDPTGLAAFLLGAAGSEQPSDAAFWGLGQPRHFRWPAGAALSAQPPGLNPIIANFAGQVELLGFSQPSCQPGPDDQPCPLILFWRALQPLTVDLKLAAYLADAGGQRWSEQKDQRLSAYQYPTFRWQPGTTVLSELPLPAAPGTPPGEYRLWLSLYDEANGRPLELLDSAGAPQGVWTVLEPARVDALVEPNAAAPQASASVEAAPGLQLLQASVTPSAAEAGRRLSLQTWWRADNPVDIDFDLLWQWLDPAGQIVGSGRTAPTGDAFPTSQWPDGSTVRGQTAVRVPRTALAGQWLLRVGLAQPGSDLFEGAWIDLPLTVLSTERSFDAPELAVVVDQAIGEAIQLLGLVDEPGALSPGDTATITLAWQSLAETERSYTAFVHLLNDAGQVVAQDDHLPLQGRRPTDTWLPGEVIVDQHLLALPSDLPPGRYRLEIGFYDANTPGLLRPGASIVVQEIAVQPRDQ